MLKSEKPSSEKSGTNYEARHPRPSHHCPTPVFKVKDEAVDGPSSVFIYHLLKNCMTQIQGLSLFQA